MKPLLLAILAAWYGPAAGIVVYYFARLRRPDMIPETWSKVMNRLGRAGWDARRQDDARTGYELGYYAALHQLGMTTSADSMAKAWHEYYGEAQADAKDALKRIKAREQGGADGR